MTDPIVAGLALRDDDAAVLALGRELAALTGAPLVLCHAYPFQPLIAVPPPDWVEDLQAQCAAELEACARGERTLCRPSPSPVRALHEAAEELGASLIVVGSSHRGPAGRVLPGGVGERLVHGSPCPVAIAPRGYEPHGLRRIGVALAGGPESADALAFARAVAPAAPTVYTVEIRRHATARQRHGRTPRRRGDRAGAGLGGAATCWSSARADTAGCGRG